MIKKKLLIILQARSNSKRLPGKVLKKINGIPIVIISAKRLSNRGADIIVATSIKKSDDKLVKVLTRNKVNYFRGSLNNVLDRYQQIAKKLNKDDFIIRATADNIFPDGEIVEEITKHINNIGADYYGINHKNYFLPKGLGIEIFTVKKILSLKKNLKKKDREHVTLPIYYKKDKYLKQKKIKKLINKKDLSKISVSIDKKKDFNFVRKIISKFKNPIKVSYKTLLKSL